MGDWTDRVGRVDGSSEVVARLEAGERLVDLAHDLGLSAEGLMATLASAALGDPESLGPTLEQVPPGCRGLKASLSAEALKGLFPSASHPDRLALSAGLLQIFDFWDASHEAAQEADDLGESHTSTYWHLIAHRREPDPGNALYWARRVGRHPIHATLVEQARPLLEAGSERSMPPGDTWPVSPLINLASQAREGSPQARLARKLQRLEMLALLEASLRRVVK